MVKDCCDAQKSRQLPPPRVGVVVALQHDGVPISRGATWEVCRQRVVAKLMWVRGRGLRRSYREAMQLLLEPEAAQFTQRCEVSNSR